MLSGPFRIASDGVGSPFGDGQDGRVHSGVGDGRHHRGVRDTQTVDAVHSEVRVDDSEVVRPDPAGAYGVVEGGRVPADVGDEVVSLAWSRLVPGRPATGPCAAPPFSALTCEESTTQRNQSRRAAAFSPASRTSCNRCRTPALFQSRSLRRHVMPDPNPRSLGRYSHWIPVCSTYKIPRSTARSGNGLRPGYRNLRSRRGSSGSRRSHSSSDTIHGGFPHRTERSTPVPDTAARTDLPHCVSRCKRGKCGAGNIEERRARPLAHAESTWKKAELALAFR